jgi:tetratricopeptide (TPR) repeat protein
MLGSAAGMTPWIIGLNKLGSAGAQHLLGAEALGVAGRIGVSASVGLVYGGLLTPVDTSHGQQWGNRLTNGLSSAATFATLTGSAEGLNSLGVTNRIAAGLLSGVPAGFVSAETQSLLSGRGPASASELGQSIGTFSYLGAITGALPRSNAEQRVAQPLATTEPEVMAARATQPVPTGETLMPPLAETGRSGETLKPPAAETGRSAETQTPPVSETVPFPETPRPAEVAARDIPLEPKNATVAAAFDASDPDYLQSTLSTRLPGHHAGSYWEGYTPEELRQAVRNADWQPFNPLDANGDPIIKPPAIGFTAEIPGGRVGMVPVDQLPDGHQLYLIDPKASTNGGKGNWGLAVVGVDEPATTRATMILGPKETESAPAAGAAPATTPDSATAVAPSISTGTAASPTDVPATAVDSATAVEPATAADSATAVDPSTSTGTAASPTDVPATAVDSATAVEPATAADSATAVDPSTSTGTAGFQPASPEYEVWTFHPGDPVPSSPWTNQLLGLDLDALPESGPLRRIPIGRETARAMGFDLAKIEAAENVDEFLGERRWGGLKVDTSRLYERALAGTDRQSPRYPAILLEYADALLANHGDAARITELANEALGSAEHIAAGTPVHVDALTRVGTRRMWAGNYAGAEPLLEQAVSIGEQLGDRVRVRTALSQLSDAQLSLGKVAESMASARRAIVIAETDGAPPAVLKSEYHQLARCALSEGKPHAAVALFRHAEALDSGQPDGMDMRQLGRMIDAETPVSRQLGPHDNPFEQQFRMFDGASNEAKAAMRGILVDRYAWGIPNEEALDAIRAQGPIVEIGAGTGYWAALLRARGADVVAYDYQPVQEGHNHFHSSRQPWTTVLPGDESMAARHPDRALFLCWPLPGDPMAVNALRAYKGDTLIFVGETGGGMHGDEAFADEIANHWRLVQDVSIPNWDVPMVNDALYIYRRV